MRLPRRLVAHLNRVFVALAVAFFAPAAHPQQQLPTEWNDAVTSLAARVVADVKPARSVSLGVRDISSLDRARGDEVVVALVAELASRGGWKPQAIATTSESSYILSTDPSAQLPPEAQVQLTLSEGSAAYVWVAQISRSGSEQIEIVAVPKQDGSISSLSKPYLTLRRNLLWTQSEPLLDFADEKLGEGRPETIAALEPDRVAYGALSAGAVSFSQSSLLRNVPASRDLRGRLELSQSGQVSALIAGTSCLAVSPGAPFTCTAAQTNYWPLGAGLNAAYIPNRNYFAGLLASSANSAGAGHPFYSAAVAGPADKFAVILTETDGKSRLYAAGAGMELSTSWGDDITALATACDSSQHLLVTGAGDWTQPDRIQLFEVSGETPSAVGQPLEFAGPILALWSSGDARSARVVSRNLLTGMYEASTVSVSCGD